MQNVLARKPSRSPEEEEFIEHMQSTWEKARKIGRDEGKAEGEAAANARAVLTVLKARRVEVPETIRRRILAEQDAKRLERWLARASVAQSVADVLGESNHA